MASGSKRKDLKDFYNVEFPPLFVQSSDEEMYHLPTIFFLPPPVLHLILGPFNDFHRALVKLHPELMQWSRDVFVTQSRYHSRAFEGNECSKLLDNVGVLETVASEKGCLLAIMPFVRTFKAFHKVKKSCFGAELGENFEADIEEFKVSVIELSSDFQVSITPKMHIIFHHVLEWCRENNQGLGKYSEHPLETSHKDFNKTALRFNVNPNSRDYGNKLLRAVVAYNSSHI